MSVVTTHEKNSVFYVTINRIEKHNALSVEVWKLLGEAFDYYAKSNLKLCVLRGAGDQAFIAGADIEQYRTMSQQEFKEFIVYAGAIQNKIFEIPKPFLAAIKGYALGGGLELALHCDLVVANRSAKLGLPELSLGLLPGGGGTQIVPRLVGRVKANEMMMRGRWLRGEESLNCGLISALFEDDTFDTELDEYISEVLKRAPSAISVLKGLMRSGLDLDLLEALKLEIELTHKLIDSSEGREGVSAFLEKRPPSFDRLRGET
jgi:enoyl-CoA hydratase/carnithine racemase